MARPIRRVVAGVAFFLGTCAIGFFGYWIAGWSAMDALYMVVITVFGVGYGEVQPVASGELRAFTISVIVAGYGAAIYAVGGFVQLVTEGEINRALGARRMTRGVAKLRDHTILCGYGRVGRILAASLADSGALLVVVDRDRDKILEAEASGPCPPPAASGAGRECQRIRRRPAEARSGASESVRNGRDLHSSRNGTRLESPCGGRVHSMSARLGEILDTAHGEEHWAGRIAGQHISLRTTAHSLEDLLGGLVQGGGDVDAATARGRLGEFFGQIVEHLRSEEREGRLAMALARAPHWQRKADLLQGEHSRFRASLAALVADAERAGGTSDWISVQRRFSAFRRAFMVHEALENEILQRAYLEDMGGGD